MALHKAILISTLHEPCIVGLAVKYSKNKVTKNVTTAATPNIIHHHRGVYFLPGWLLNGP